MIRNNMELIKQLKEEHVKILEGFEVIRKGVAEGESENIDVVSQLKDSKNILIKHLGLEDERLYPGLINAGGEAKELGEKFSNEMLEISNTTIVFFEKYMNVAFFEKNKSEVVSNLLQSSEFRKELDDIMQALSKRIEAEENILFPAYEKYCNNNQGT